MTFNISNLKTIVEDKILAVDLNTPDIDLVKLSKLADRTQATRSALDAEIQTRLTDATASDELFDLLVLSKSSDEVVQTGDTAIGGIKRLWQGYPDVYEENNQKFLRSGYLITSGWDSSLSPIINSLFVFGAAPLNMGSVSALASNYNNIFIGGGSGGNMTRSFNNGVSWSSGTNSVFGTNSITDIAYGSSNDTWVAVGLSGRIARSFNNGDSWASANSGSTFYSSTILGVAANDSGRWVIVGTNGRVFVSANNAASWYSATSNYGNKSINSIASGSNETWIAVGASNGTGDDMIRSTDDGETWAFVSSTFGSWDIIQDIDTDNAGVWIAVGASGILARSTDNGSNWSRVSSPFGSGTINSVTTDKKGIWMAVGTNGITAVSRDNGENWELVDSGYGDFSISIVVSDTEGTFIGAGQTASAFTVFPQFGINTGHPTDYVRFL